MKNTKMILSLTALLISVSALADEKDLNILGALDAGGAAAESFMSQLHYGVDDIQCKTNPATKTLECTMTDIAANNGQGARLVISGDKALALLNALEIGDWPGTTSGELKIQSVRCNMAYEGVMDGSEADRTSCSVDLGVD